MKASGLRRTLLPTLALGGLLSPIGRAAESPSAPTNTPPQPGEMTGTAEQRVTQLTREVEALKNLVHQLQDQVANIARAPTATAAPAAASAAAAPAPPAQSAPSPEAPAAASTQVAAELLHGVTINGLFDGYYEYNTNSPAGRVNSLRAYDVSSNSFSINQAVLIVESAADLSAGKRFGLRVDLQYGQATETLQGNPANELRADVYRNLYQAYGTYIFPIGRGLTVDFGKWGSTLGIEGNYTKDQLNYSRAFWYNYLPFYHTGFRAKYPVNDQLAVNLWITNGTQQTEDVNGYKDQLLGLVLTPTPSMTWTLNYYRGQEHPDVAYLQAPGPGQQGLPNQQGTAVLPLANPPDGKLQIGDTYLSWQATKALILAAEADYAEERLYSYSPAKHVAGGALYAGYQLTPEFSMATRAEYLADAGGLFSGTVQYLREGTLTFDYRPASGFLLRTEYRRDWSNRQYFPGHEQGTLETTQATIGVGMVWWFGQKEGSW